MNTETSRQAYIRLLRGRVEALDSLTEQQREVVLMSELITGDYLDGVVHPNGSGFPVGYSVLGIKPDGRLFLKQLEKEESDSELTRKNLEDFKTLDRREIFRMQDKPLAEWQSKFRPEDPQWKLAEYEWQRRLTFEQIRTSLNVGKQSAIFAVIASVAGSIIGVILTLVVQELSRR
jgi:hypothetical protein